MTQTIGEQLKQARTNRGLTLEQVSQAIFIRKHYLEALENDQRDALPSNVQGRGFLRLYASHLDLPIAGLLAAWDGKAPLEPAAPVTRVLDDGEVAAQPTAQPTTPQPAVSSLDEPEPLNTVLAPAPSPADFAPVEPVTSQPAGGSQAIFGEVGQILRQQREALGLSWAEIERYTRLRQHYIKALEDGRMEDLPSPVQGRGMLSNYAAFLNLNEEKILLRFAEGLQARRVERIPKPEPQGLFNNKKRPARQAPLWRRFLTPDLIFGVGVVTIILFFALWTAARINNLRTAEVNPTPPGISAILLTPQETSAGTLAAAGSTTTPGTAEPTTVAGEAVGVVETASPADPQIPADSTDTVPGSVQAAITPQATVDSSVTLQPINSDPLQVYIVARQRAWLRVVTDDKIKFLGRVVPGNAYAFSGAKRIELATGNAAALQVFYNQNDLGTLGVSGQAVGLVFSPEGIMTPTPAFTETPTPTQPATVTPLPTETPQPSPTVTPFIP